MPSRAALARRAGNARPAHLAIIGRTLYWIAFAQLVLKTRGFAGARTMLHLSPVEPVERSVDDLVDALTPEQTRALVWAFRIVDLVKPSCLPKSIALERVLAAAGIGAEIVIGVVMTDGFRAHAWVEVEGRLLRAEEQGDHIWKPLARFGRAR